MTSFSIYFFFTDTAPPEIYTLSLHDALPISEEKARDVVGQPAIDLLGHARVEAAQARLDVGDRDGELRGDRKSTRLNSSHVSISYAVFCLKKKKKIQTQPTRNYTMTTTRQSS